MAHSPFDIQEKIPNHAQSMRHSAFGAFFIFRCPKKRKTVFKCQGRPHLPAFTAKSPLQASKVVSSQRNIQYDQHVQCTLYTKVGSTAR